MNLSRLQVFYPDKEVVVIPAYPSDNGNRSPFSYAKILDPQRPTSDGYIITIEQVIDEITD